MARIIHVEDEPYWIDVVRRALRDHEVDSARTWEQALALLHGPVSYELALIDLNLSGGSDDKEGGELLDVLRVDFPATRRVVITAVPPAGDLRSRIYERYGVLDLIIKDKTTLPDLQLVVRRALRQEPDDPMPAANLHASELRERCRDWRDFVQQEIRAGVREAELFALHSGRVAGHAADEATGLVGDWKKVQQEFIAECERIEGLIATAQTAEDLSAATGQLDQAMTTIQDRIGQMRDKSQQVRDKSQRHS